MSSNPGQEKLISSDRNNTLPSVASTELGEEIGRDHDPTAKASIYQPSAVNPSTSDTMSASAGEYTLYKYRWVQLALFSLAALINQVAWISLQPVAEQVSQAYDQTAAVVNTVALVYMGLFIIFTFPSNYVIDMYGCRQGVVLGAFLTALGMIIKCFINSNFYICIAGQVVSGIGQPFLVNAPTKLAAVWFGQNERVIAVTIAIAAQALGAAVGFVIPALFVSVDDEGELFREHVAQSLICQACLGSAVFLGCLLFFKARPATPPSATAF